MSLPAEFQLEPLPAPVERNTCKPVNQAQGHGDDFQTPAWAVEPLLPYLDRSWTIWEPACGKGNIVRALQGHGYEAFGTDLREGWNFLNYLPYASWDAQVTNPPYSIKDEWIARSYALGKPFALLLPLAALESQERQRMYRQHGVELLFFNRRVDFETPSGKQGGAWFATFWLCWKLLPQPVIFHELRGGAQAELALEGVGL